MDKKMSSLIKLEELGQFLLSIFLFSKLSYSWWVFPALILLPDFSMIGYAISTLWGARLYNLFHHKFLGIALIIAGYFLSIETLSLSGIILFGHAAMDRIFGYGLKYNDDFKHTHLGWIGKKSNPKE